MEDRKKSVAGTCPRCGETRPEAFTPSQRIVTGGWCKACHAAYRRERMYGQRSRAAGYQDVERIKRSDWLRNEKAKVGCQRCGERDPACLDFHHVDESTKRLNIATQIHQLSKAKIEAEIEKTIVLCSNCHRKLHFYEKSGTYSGRQKGVPRKPRGP